MFGNWFKHATDDSPFAYAEVSDIGGRKTNQDYCLHEHHDDWILLITADGLGGHGAGELASSLFSEAMRQRVLEHAIELLGDASQLKELAEQARQDMAEALRQRGEDIDPHTTCTVVWINLLTRAMATLHVGDSRIYRFNTDEIIWRTRDHSVVQMLVDNGDITEEEMGTHPDQSMLTRSINQSEPIKVTFKQHPAALTAGEAILLCSDGFWEFITNEEICELVTVKDLPYGLKERVSWAKQRAGKNGDNVTAQVLIIRTS